MPSLDGVTPFLSTDSADLFLLPASHDASHMDALVRLGMLSSYRYVDACPSPAILGIRSRP